MYDRYNFELRIKPYYGQATYSNFLIWSGNNTAWLSEYNDVIVAYDWETVWLTEKKGSVRR